jgi:hypothetical protein
LDSIHAVLSINCYDLMNRGPSFLIAAAALSLTQANAETRIVSPLPAPTGMSVDPASRLGVLTYYQTYYPASEGAADRMGWAGNSLTGVAGTTTAAFKDDVLRRINFYRGLCTFPTSVTFDATKSAECQQAALMMSANNTVSHNPGPGLKFYTADGAEAAANSNLTLTYFGPDAIDAYMADVETGNEATSHRRWLLYSLAAEMGTGDIPANNGKSSSNSLWVKGPPFSANQKVDFATWPNAGYAPAPLCPVRWSVSYPNADFSSATVTMKKGAVNVPLSIISKSAVGFGDSAIVWVPTGISTAEGSTYTVTISGITGKAPATKTYSVTFFDPDSLGQSTALEGPATIPLQGAAFRFDPVPGAEVYQVEVSQQGASQSWIEGAEDVPAPQIVSGTTGTYALRETAVAHSGAKSFHLVFPTFTDQFFTVDRNIVPQATSHLTFFELSKITTSDNTLAAEISQDNGATWTPVWKRNGVKNSILAETVWTPVDVDLSAYAGKVVRVRFAARYVSSAFAGNTGPTYGFYVDDIAVSNTLAQSSVHQTELPAGVTSFTLNSAIAGFPLAEGAVFQVRVRPGIGSHWFDFSPSKTVIVHPTADYTAWAALLYPGLTGGFAGDSDHDGLSNGIEYAFALDPLRPDSHSAVPSPVVTDSVVAFDYDQPSGISDLIYGAQWSFDLTTWTSLPDLGSGNHHHFEVSTTGKPAVYLRHQIQQKGSPL